VTDLQNSRRNSAEVLLEGIGGRLFGHQIALSNFLLPAGDVSIVSIEFPDFTFSRLTLPQKVVCILRD
jgi:hypothetical protein